MENNNKMKLKDIILPPISGEWGNDDEDGNGVLVLRTTNFTNEGIINYENIITRKINKKNINHKYLQKGDILIEKSGGSEKQPVGRVVYFEGEEYKYLFNNFTSVLRIKNKNFINSKYLFLYLYSYYKNGGTLVFQNKTTGLHNLKLEQFVASIEIPVLSISEQQRVANELDKVSELIDKRQTQLQKLDLLIKSKFVEMFGNISGKKVALQSICDIGSSKRIYEKEYVESGIPFYRTKEIVELAYGNNITTELFITRDRYNEIKNKYGVPQKNDLLVSAVGTIGVIWLVDCDKEFYYKDGNLLIIKSSDKFNSKFMKILLERAIANYKTKMSTGTAYMALTIIGLKNMEIYLPPIELQNQFADFVDKVEQSKIKIKASLDKLNTLKKALMQKYFG